MDERRIAGISYAHVCTVCGTLGGGYYCGHRDAIRVGVPLTEAQLRAEARAEREHEGRVS